MEDCRVRSNEEEVINVDGNVSSTPLKDRVVSVDGFETFGGEKFGEGFIPYTWRLFKAIQSFVKLANAARVVT